MKRLVLLQNFVQGYADLLLVLPGFGLDGKSDGGLRIFDGVVNDRRLFIAKRVARLRLFKFYASNNVTSVSLRYFVQLFALNRMQHAKAFQCSAAGVEYGGVIL